MRRLQLLAARQLVAVAVAGELLGEIAGRHGLLRPRVDVAGTVIVHSDASGYAALMNYAAVAAQTVGVWVNVVADDALAAQVDAEEL